MSIKIHISHICQKGSLPPTLFGLCNQPSGLHGHDFNHSDEQKWNKQGLCVLKSQRPWSIPFFSSNSPWGSSCLFLYLHQTTMITVYKKVQTRMFKWENPGLNRQWQTDSKHQQAMNYSFIASTMRRPVFTKEAERMSPVLLHAVCQFK